MIRCQCGETMKKSEFEIHKYNCYIPCPNKCGARITKNESQTHFSKCKQICCDRCDLNYLFGSQHSRDICDQNLFRRVYKTIGEHYHPQQKKLDSLEARMNLFDPKLSILESNIVQQYYDRRQVADLVYAFSRQDALIKELKADVKYQDNTISLQNTKIASLLDRLTLVEEQNHESKEQNRKLLIKIDNLAASTDARLTHMMQLLQNSQDKTKAKSLIATAGSAGSAAAAEVDSEIPSDMIGMIVTIENFINLPNTRVRRHARMSVHIGTIVSTHRVDKIVMEKKKNKDKDKVKEEVYPKYVYTVNVEFPTGIIPFVANSKGQFDLVYA
jgi:hypothetical protein